MAEAIEDLGSCQISTCSTLDSEKTDTDNGGGWCELPRLIELRNKLRSEMRDSETQAFTVEQEICGDRVGEEQSLCGSCGLVKEPRQRKIAVLRLMHRAILTSKPKHLLCTAGIITHLESMILAGYLDCGSTNKVTRCRHCRQDTDEDALKGYILSEFIDILEEQRSKCTNKENCSMTEACCACLDFMLSQLKGLYEFITILNSDGKDDPNLAQESIHHHRVPSESKPQDDTPQHSNASTEPKNETTQNHDQDDTKNLNIDSELINESTPIPDQDDARHSNAITKSEKTTPEVIDRHNTQCSNYSDEPKDETTPVNHAKRNVAIANESSPILDQDVTNDLVEGKKVQDCELHSHIDAATILFKNVFTKQLQSLTAELDKMYVEQINQQENQKELATEITLLKWKLQDRVKPETMHSELTKIQKELVSEMNRLKEKVVTNESIHSIQQDCHEKLACKMDQLKCDLKQRVTPEKLKAELEIHHEELCIKLDRMKEKFNNYVRTENIQDTLDKHTNIQNNLIAQWNNYFTNHGKECVTTETMQAELTNHTNRMNDLVAQWNNYITNHGKECVTTKSMQQESSKTLTEHLYKLNAIQDQLTRLEDGHKKLRAEFSDQKYKQSKKVLDLQVDVGNLKRNQESYGLAIGTVNSQQNQASAMPNPYRCPKPYPPFYTPFH